MIIRPAVKDDHRGIRALVLQVHALHASGRPDIYRSAAEADPFPEEDFASIVDDPASIVLVAEDEGKIAGFCLTAMRKPSANPILMRRSVAFMNDLCVDAQYRRHGVGTMLLEAAKSAVRERGADSLELMVWSFNDAALAFYRRHGMTVRSYVMEQKL